MLHRGGTKQAAGRQGRGIWVSLTDSAPVLAPDLLPASTTSTLPRQDEATLNACYDKTFMSFPLFGNARRPFRTSDSLAACLLQLAPREKMDLLDAGDVAASARSLINLLAYSLTPSHPTRIATRRIRVWNSGFQGSSCHSGSSRALVRMSRLELALASATCSVVAVGRSHPGADAEVENGSLSHSRISSTSVQLPTYMESAKCRPIYLLLTTYTSLSAATCASFPTSPHFHAINNRHHRSRTWSE